MTVSGSNLDVSGAADALIGITGTTAAAIDNADIVLTTFLSFFPIGKPPFHTFIIVSCPCSYYTSYPELKTVPPAIYFLIPELFLLQSKKRYVIIISR